MKRVGQTVIGAAGLGVALLSSQASAAPTCTGTTMTITASPTTLQDSFLVGIDGQSNGNCVAAGDKLFGNFTFGPAGNQLPFADEIAQFNVPASPFVGTYEISFTTTLGPGLTASQFGYEVMTTDPTVALIDDFEKDASFSGALSSITLTGSINGAPMINCTRTQGGGQVGTVCPEIVTFTPIQDVVVRENATTSAAPSATLTDVTDTISQVAPPPVPEPASLVLLGSALVGFGVVVRRRRKAE